MGKKYKKPKIKMRSYGDGQELPTIKSKEGLFKKPEFFLIGGDYYDPESNTKFPGESTTPIKGPSKRAIKGKGKRSGEAYLEIGRDSGRPTHADDFAAMENINPIKQKYSSQSGMESAVKRWQSPHKLTGDPDKSTFNYADKNRAKTEKEKFGVTSKKGQEKKIAKEKKKADKEAYKKTDEFKEKRAKQQDTVQAVGRAMMAYAGLKPGEAGESATAKLKKEKAPSEEAEKPKTDLHTDHSGDVLKSNTPKFKFRKGNQGESKADYEAAYDAAHDKFKKDNPNAYSTSNKTTGGLQRRGDIEAMSSMMRKIKNPRKVEKEKISGSDFGTGSFTGTKKTITKGDKTIVKTKKKGDDGTWKKKTSEKTVGDEYGDGKVKYVDKSKYNRKASEKNPKKKIKKTKVKEVYESGEKVKDTYKVKRVDGKNRRKATRKDGEWKAKKK